MPCSPRAIRVGKYSLIATLEKAEREEAAARILSFSLQLDQWVGVSWHRLVEMMQGDYELCQRAEKAQEHNFNERERIQRAMWKYYILSILTIGIYALFVAKPVAQMHEIPEIPFSGIFMFGPQHVFVGVQELVEREMLLQVRDGEDDVFFPTPALVSRIMQKQSVVA